ncbi:MAG: glycosyltransferase family 39 protein, partial [Phycisphaerae bacterium]|nr:glycosyltransferase family 39 protein [Phycisphaerae bacterium]
MPEHDDTTGPAPQPPRQHAIPAQAGQAPTPLARIRRGLLPAALILAATVLVYLPSLRNGFIWDDDFYVTDNTNLRSWSGLAAIWTQPTTSPQYYPLVFTTFWIEHHLWGGHPLGYHLVNVLLHGFSAVILWRLLRRLGVPGAFLAGVVFAIHPVHVESVAWVTERKNVLSGLLYLLAVGAYLRFDPPPGARRRWGFYALAAGLFAGALLSKTVTCTLPAALGLILWWKRPKLSLRDLWPLAPLLLVGAAMGLTTAWLEKVH